MHYRSEVDGLRTIAVLPVLMFHAGVSLMPSKFLDDNHLGIFGAELTHEKRSN